MAQTETSQRTTIQHIQHVKMRQHEEQYRLCVSTIGLGTPSSSSAAFHGKSKYTKLQEKGEEPTRSLHKSTSEDPSEASSFFSSFGGDSFTSVDSKNIFENFDITQSEGKASDSLEIVEKRAPSQCETRNVTKSRRDNVESPKRVSFAVNPDGTVPRKWTRKYTKDTTLRQHELWSSESEWTETLAVAERMGEWYKEDFPGYVKAIKWLCYSYNKKPSRSSDKKTERHLRQVMAHSQVRGFELHIVGMKRQHVDEHQAFVLGEQLWQRQQGNESQDEGLEAIRKVSERTSKASAHLALIMGFCDEYEAASTKQDKNRGRITI